jgi:hypothetical protein
MAGQPSEPTPRPIIEFFVETAIEILYGGTFRAITIFLAGVATLIGYYLSSSGWSLPAAIALAGLIAVFAFAGLLVVLFSVLLIYRRGRARSK